MTQVISRIIASQECINEKRYWVDKIKGVYEKTIIEYDQHDHIFQENKFNKLELIFKPDMNRIIDEICGASEFNLHILLSAVLAGLLRKLSGQNDIIFATPVFEREYDSASLNNMLIIKQNINGDLSFGEFLKNHMAKTIDEARKNQNYAIEAIREHFFKLEEKNENPLFDIVILLDSFQNQKYIRDYQHNILFHFKKKDQQFALEINYNPNKYSENKISRILNCYVLLLERMIKNPGKKLNSFSLLDDKDSDIVFNNLNKTISNYPKDKTIDQLFREQAKLNPNKIAVSYKDQKITYGVLNELSDNLYLNLKSKGIKEGNIIGINSNYSIDLIIGILGIIKAGCTYLPINFSYPSNRINFIINDSCLNCILTNEIIHKDLIDAEQILIRDLIKIEGNNDLSSTNNPIFPLYIIYTSGTTGQPKGTVINHYSVIRLVRNTNYIQLNPKTRILQTGALEFDASTFEIWGTLLNGGSLILIEKEEIPDPKKLGINIKNYDVNTIWMTSTLCNQIVENNIRAFETLNYLLVGGEKLSVKHINKLVTSYKNLKIINGYGPTENTTFSLCHLIKGKYEYDIPIGIPISNSTAFITDIDFKPLPVGIKGELCVGGDGLMRGYLNDPELTAKSIVQLSDYEGDLFYRTGDLGFVDNEGDINFKGRKDKQIKIRGFRIEGTEIENVMCGFEGVNQVEIVPYQFSVDSQGLIAYYTGDSELDADYFKNRLKECLPEYMIPFIFIYQKSFPLTSNGKLDYRALPLPKDKIKEDQVSKTETEKILHKIWAENLNIDISDFGLHANYFELGGHSLKATLLANLIEEAFNIELSLTSIFENQTIYDLAIFIDKQKFNRYKPIKKTEKKEYYELSSAQNRLYLVHQMKPDSLSYNIPLFVILSGDIKKKKIQETLDTIVNNNSIFRTSFENFNNRPIQKAHNNVQVNLIEFSKDLDEKELFQQFVKSFDLKKAPLIRAGIKKLDADQYIFMVDFHHIIFDGTSISLFVKEFVEYYNSGQLFEKKIEYVDFANWQNRKFKLGLIDEQKKYWNQKFSIIPETLDLPYDFQRSLVKSFDGEVINFEVDQDLINKLFLIIENQKDKTLFMLCLAAYYILLYKVTGNNDINVGIPIAGRNNSSVNEVIGMFINVLPFRIQMQGDYSLNQFLEIIKGETLNSFENQDYQFDSLVDDLNIERDISRNPLFDIAFSFHNEVKAEEITEIKTKSISLKPYNSENNYKYSKFDITLNINKNENCLFGSFEYSKSLFKSSTIEKFVKYYIDILGQLTIGNLNNQIRNISLLSKESQYDQLIKHNLQSKLIVNKTLVDLFLEQVEKDPDAIALEFEKDKLSYSELNIYSDNIARVLIEKGIGNNQLVGLIMNRSIEMAVAILAVLKTEAGYLPIDPYYPEQRVKLILEDANVNLVILSKNINSGVYDIPSLILDLNEISNLPTEEPINSFPKLKDIAYVIYTSGSTGNPKGVIVSHEAISNTIQYRKQAYNIQPDEVHLQLFNYCFDGFLTSFFTPLISGCKIVLLNLNNTFDLNVVKDAIQKSNVSHLITIPQIFNSLLKISTTKELVSLREVVLAGENIPQVMFDNLKLLGIDTKISQEYGVTECAVMSTINRHLNKKDSDNIGNSIPNNLLVIVNKDGQIQPEGLFGEICLSGIGLAFGYLNNPELTFERFSKEIIKNENVYYKTGDLGLWESDGSILFKGRLDNQVKIRGFRIELGEIHNHLIKYPNISDAIVVLRKDSNGENYISAYYKSDIEISIEEISSFLSNRLPSHMVPLSFMRLKEFPLLNSGKININELPEPNSSINKKIVNPRNNVEEVLLRIWKETLGLKKEEISVLDNFYALGGNSLNATQLNSRIQQELNVRLPLVKIFKTPILADQAILINKETHQQIKRVSKAEKKEYYLISPSQRRFHFLGALNNDTTLYNVTKILDVPAGINFYQIENAVLSIIKKHEILRTSFHNIEGRIYQKIHESVHFKLIALKEEIGNKSLKVNELIKPFDLTTTPLIRCTYFEDNLNGNKILIDMPHVITDGISVDILTDEIFAFLEGAGEQNLGMQYKDYAEWINRMTLNKNYIKKRDYWFNKFKKEIPVINLPEDFKRPRILEFEGAAVKFVLKKSKLNSIHKLLTDKDITNFTFFLSVYYIFLSKITNQKDIIIGSPTSNRLNSDFEKMLGVFINILPLRISLDENLEYIDFIQRLKSEVIESLDNQEYPIEDIIEKVSLERDLSRNPLFDVMYFYDDSQKDSLNNQGIKLDSFSVSEEMDSKYDLIFSCKEENDSYNLILNYRKNLFKDETIVKFSEYILNIIDNLEQDSNVLLHSINILSNDDLNMLQGFSNPKGFSMPIHENFIQQFSRQVEMDSEKPCIKYEGRTISYGELKNKSNSVAHELIGQGVCSNKPIGVYLNRSVEMVAAILGIMKAGGIFIPIDIKLPKSRVEYMIKDANISFMISSDEYINKLDDFGLVKYLNIEKIISKKNNISFNLSQFNESDLAYIIYTSGSTGKPKGVSISHLNLQSFILGINNELNIERFESILSVTTISFDIFILELLYPLVYGKTIILTSENEQNDLNELSSLIKESNVDVVQFTPSRLQLLYSYEPSLESLKNVKLLLVGGEVFPDDLFENIRGKFDGELMNLYGPTETTIWSSISKLKRNEPITIGKPLKNVEIQILDEDLNLCPVNVPGEICIKGKIVSDGYINKPELTYNSFTKDSEGEMLYRTGDYGKWDSKGEIIIFGRKDQQVKIRGYRIELNEIEEWLNKYDGISKVVVIVNSFSKIDKRIFAFYNSEKELSNLKLRKYLRQYIPDYMIPSKIIFLDKFPLNRNDKIDHRELLKISNEYIDQDQHSKRAPNTILEKEIAAIWAENTQNQYIGLDDNYFDIGGNSLNMVKSIHNIKEKYGVEPKQIDFFNNTLEQFTNNFKMKLEGESS